MAGFSIYPRQKKNGKSVYYVQFKNPDNTYSTARSTGKTSRRAAEEWAENELLKNGSPLPGHNITFGEYSQDFFSWNGRWATNLKVEGRRISERHCRDRCDLMRIHVLPVFANYYLKDIDKISIINFRNSLFNKGYSGSQINKCLYAIKAILEAAEDQGLIKAVPKISRAADNPKQKGILTIEEVNRLFSFQWMSKPSYSHPERPLFMGYAGNLLAASTGIRLSELQGLKIQDLNLESGYIVIKRAWDNRLNKLNNSTKTGRERNIFIPEKVITVLNQLLLQHPFPENPEAFLFWGEKKPEEKPAEKVVFINALFTTLEQIGINETERKQRNITFHSWRHFLNSLLLNAKIPIQKIQSITGHLTNEMTSHYYHVDDMSDVRQIQETLFTMPVNIKSLN